MGGAGGEKFSLHLRVFWFFFAEFFLLLLLKTGLLADQRVAKKLGRGKISVCECGLIFLFSFLSFAVSRFSLLSSQIVGGLVTKEKVGRENLISGFDSLSVAYTMSGRDWNIGGVDFCLGSSVPSG